MLSLSSFAQPQGINYQGVARNATGIPLINQNIALRLSILDGTASGTILYTETQNTTTNYNGLFNIGIGAGTVLSGIFDDILWGQGDKWLKVEMDTAAGSNFLFIGTSQFLSVPYSYYSTKSKTSENGLPTIANSGDMLYYDGSSWVNIAPGNYGQILTLCNGVPTWGGCLPQLVTTAISAISGDFAMSGGNLISDGGTTITSRGVCWSTSSNPTLANNFTSDGTGIGTYSSSITGLTPSTTYYVRAYATNAVGTIYGNQQSFTTTNVIPFVTICTQDWMTQNLAVSTYRNGDPIPEVTDPTQWASLTTGAWCYYNNNSTTGATYGKLYNWYAVNDPRGLAPLGWHVPTEAEWNILETCLDGAIEAGGKMKTMGTSHWAVPNVGATNSSGFSGLPGGFRTGDDGTFTSISTIAVWWSSTEYIPGQVWTHALINDNSYELRLGNYRDAGCNVRCIRD